MSVLLELNSSLLHHSLAPGNSLFGSHFPASKHTKSLMLKATNVPTCRSIHDVWFVPASWAIRRGFEADLPSAKQKDSIAHAIRLSKFS
jgi:hypothetical protein